METNKILREELERSRQTLEKTSKDLEQAKNQVECLRKAESENKKLRELLIEEKSYKGEEIDVLVHALYHLRQKMRSGEELKHRVLKQRNMSTQN